MNNENLTICNGTLIVSNIHHYVTPMFFERMGFQGYSSLEETLIQLLTEKNYFSHYIPVFLKRWSEKINWREINEILNVIEKRVLFSYLEILEVNIPYSFECPEIYERNDRLVYPSYMSDVDRRLYDNEFKEKLKIVEEKYGVYISLTKKDLAVCLNQNYSSEDLLPIMQSLVVGMNNIFDKLTIPYAIGGGLSSFFNIGIESSADIDIVVFDYITDEKMELLLELLTNKLDLQLKQTFKNYVNFLSGDSIINIDIEFGQHYKQSLPKGSQERLNYILIKDKRIPILSLHDVLQLKSNRGRLKDINSISKIQKIMGVSNGYL